MDLQDEIKALKERIVELEEQQEFPRDGDRYWYIDSDGEVLSSEWERFPSEEHMLELGNIYRTEEEAEFDVEKKKVETELRKYSIPFELYKDNYSIELSWEDMLFTVDSYGIYQSVGVVYFGSEQKAWDAIEAVGEERIKKYIFGVEE